MKVCTDACLFASWAADKIRSDDLEITSVLDIGTGTGLLTLMLAQKLPALFDAIEIDKAAFEQAKENFLNSPWSERLTAYNADVKEFGFVKQYDVIVSNPPFFEGSLNSPDSRKNTAKHASALTFDELAAIICSQLKEEGKFYLLLPFADFPKFAEKACGKSLFLNQQVHIRQTPQHACFRTMGVFSKLQQADVDTGIITIKNDENHYTKEFKELLKEYYLHL